MRFTRIGLALMSAVALNACGANGILGLNPQPSGGIVVKDQATGQTLNTSFANPYIVSGGSFAVAITEPHLSGAVTVSVISWTNPYNEPCFEPHQLTGNDNIIQFVAVNAAQAGVTASGSPCSSFPVTGGYNTDEETATISDGHGNTQNFYYQIAGANTGTGGTTPGSSSTVARISLYWDGLAPSVGGTCGAYLLQVIAFDSTGTQIIGQTYSNPITLSTSNYNTSGFSTAVAGIAPAPPPAGETCSNVMPIPGPGGTPTLVVPNTTTPSVVYWQPAASFTGTTTISATAIGATQISSSLTIDSESRRPMMTTPLKSGSKLPAQPVVTIPGVLAQ